MKKKTPKGLDAPALKYILSGLLVLTAIIHGLTGGFMEPSPQRIGILVFGALYLAAGVYVRSGGRTAVLVAMLLAALGLGVGGADYLARGGPIALPLMFLIDALILAAGGAWLNLSRRKSS